MMRNYCFGLTILSCSIACFAAPALSQVAPPAAPPKAAPAAGDKDQQKAEAILKQMANYLGSLPAFSCKVQSVLEIKSTEQAPQDPKSPKANAANQGEERVTKFTMRLARPNRFALIVDEGVMGLTIVSDGKQLYQFLPFTKRYIVKPAPADLNGVTDNDDPLPFTILGASDVVIPTSGETFFKRFMENVKETEFVGQEKVDEVLCDHVRCIQEEFDWDIWIEAGARPVVHKVQPDLTKQMAAAGGQFASSSITYTITLTDWNVAPKFTPDDFKFTPPAGAQQADSLIPEPVQPPHPLLGQPAPDFTTTNLEGQPVNLKDYVGKNVVLLDFWATWCGPCVHAMPEVDEVAKKYKDKGLVFYTVNMGEDAATIKSFLTEAKLSPPVALDLNSKIAELYKVEAIPQTLLIGKDGKVQVVHVGFSPRMPKLLASEIDDLLAGKDLATATLKKAAEAQRGGGGQGPGRGQ